MPDAEPLSRFSAGRPLTPLSSARMSFGPLLTHAPLVALTCLQYALLAWWPSWLILIPAVMIQHRIGILLHEYIHCIPFRRNTHNWGLLWGWDILLLGFGLLEVFRCSHLAHHRWLNTDRDPAFQTEQRLEPLRGLPRVLASLELVDQFLLIRANLRDNVLGIRFGRVALGFAASVVWLVALLWLGGGMIVLGLLVSTAGASLLASSFRGAVEHHGAPGESHSTNEYRAFFLFNMNRHRHHHAQPALPWYALRFQTPRPLGMLTYWTHWYRTYLRRQYRLLKPAQRG